ncbi:hypothetical protein HOP50_12g67780 [Chloropicon primus]|uniref:Uncharacterized protein n=1 Tax=Chloropicon primus TaxID=1764295 RepID=A0A5B8MXI9_9CHLO|nr:hypothetical protein A3770_12p67600 [Chloropicon primus]UPR03449.1 hypothetical protein HOP50_12g67780 [Chloropicon primus]|eukprot:QDZ24242.1 hypothetical protein A3770_12p67600 [Chloropicon primus]
MPRGSWPRVGVVGIVVGVVALSLCLAVVRADVCSSQPTQFVFSREQKLAKQAREDIAASALEACDGTHDYDPFPSQSYKVRSGWLRELSGLARSGIHNDVFWGHNDGKVNDVFAIRLGTDESLRGYPHRHQPGDVIARAHLPSQVERQTDWEDIDNGLCPDGSGRSCLWIADTGDNSKRRNRQRVHVVVEPDVEMNHGTAGSGKFYDIHVCKKDHWTFQFEFEYADDSTGLWVKGGSFDVEAMVVAPQGNKVWLFEKKQHWEKEVYAWPRVFESDDIAEALAGAGKDRFVQIKMRQITTFPRACEKAPEAWEWLSRPENALFGRKIIEDEKIATNVYKYKKLHEYGNQQGLIDMFMNGTDCTSFPPIFWMITGANLHPSGKRLAVQTYSGAFEYVFSEPLNFKELKDIKPRQLGLPRFDQVESIVYSHDGRSLFAIPESLGKKGWQDVEQITCRAKPKDTEEEGEEPEDEGSVGTDALAIRSVQRKVEANATTTEPAVPPVSWTQAIRNVMDVLVGLGQLSSKPAQNASSSAPGVDAVAARENDDIPASWRPILSGLGYDDPNRVLANSAEPEEPSFSHWLTHLAPARVPPGEKTEEALVPPDRIKASKLYLEAEQG